MKRLFAASLLVFAASRGMAADATLDAAQVISMYGAAWNQTDAAGIHKFLDKSWAEKGQYTDPETSVRGREELVTYIQKFRAKVGTAQLALNGPVDVHHGWFRFAWSVVASDGAVVLKGMDIGQLADDGRIRRIVGFFDAQH